jgi:phage gpG-like protein
MDIDISVDISEALDELSQVAARAADVRPVMERARGKMGEIEGAIFASQGASVGGWAPLSPGYALWKAAHYPGSPPMVQSGELLADLTSLRGPGNDVDADGATFVTNIEYAKYHVTGTRHMPARQLWPDQGDAVTEIFGRWIAEQIDDWVDPGVDI